WGSTQRDRSFGKVRVCREFPAAVPDGLAVLGGVRREADGVPGHLAGVDCAVAVADLHTGLGQAGEELVFRPCSGSGGANLPGKPDPGWLGPGRPARPRVRRRAAVRSAGAVARRPNWRSACWHASRTWWKLFHVFGRRRSWRAKVATRWM